MYRSVHLEDRPNSTNKIKSAFAEKPQKDSVTETPMFSSFHLVDSEKTESKSAASKRETKYLETAENTKPEPAKKFTKTVQQKSTARKSDSAKTVSKTQPNKLNLLKNYFLSIT